jgi:predicted transcriptional regulator
MSLKPPVSELERAVMDAIWTQGSATAADVQKALAGERPLRDSTIRTVLLRLEEKGYVRHEVSGRTFVYCCLEPPRSIAARAVQQIVDRFCQGSLEALLAGMVDNELVDTQQLREIVDRLSHERQEGSDKR